MKIFDITVSSYNYDWGDAFLLLLWIIRWTPWAASPVSSSSRWRPANPCSFTELGLHWMLLALHPFLLLRLHPLPLKVFHYILLEIDTSQHLTYSLCFVFNKQRFSMFLIWSLSRLYNLTHLLERLHSGCRTFVYISCCCFHEYFFLQPNHSSWDLSYSLRYRHLTY